IFGGGLEFTFFEIPAQAELSENLQLIARYITNGFPHYLFAVTLSVYRGGIYGSDAVLPSRMDSPDRIIFLSTAPLPAAKRPGAEGDGRKFQIGTSECSVNHNQIVLYDKFFFNIDYSNVYSMPSVSMDGISFVSLR